jgi:putative Mg2+ transporter-C (MgtC) family protein
VLSPRGLLRLRHDAANAALIHPDRRNAAVAAIKSSANKYVCEDDPGLVAPADALPSGVFFARLGIATVLGLAIGFERQWRQRAAGLHVMTLVAVGAALFCAMPALGGKVSDPWRIAAQVVTGVGFLAGGVILRQGFDVRGLTTAATLWATAAVGALVGSGFEWQGAVGAAVIVSVNTFAQPLAWAISQIPRPSAEHSATSYVLRIACAASAQNRVRECIYENVGSTSLTLEELTTSAVSNGSVEIVANLNRPGRDDGIVERVRNKISDIAGVSSVSAESAEHVV